jgi:hypothetical protein
MTKARPLTEEQWLTAREPWVMLRHLQQHCTITRVPGGRRRLRLFCCACCRQIWHLFEDERCRHAVEVAERYATGEVRKRELHTAWEQCHRLYQQLTAKASRPRPRLGEEGAEEEWARVLVQSLAGAAEWTVATSGALPAAQIVTVACQNASNAHHSVLSRTAWRDAPSLGPTQSDFLRDIFGNPFAPVVNINPEWLRWNHGTVERLARTLLAERAFDQMPVLGDALEEAGCDDPRVLDHCRQNAPHTLGCWLLELLLGKDKPDDRG